MTIPFTAEQLAMLERKISDEVILCRLRIVDAARAVSAELTRPSVLWRPGLIRCCDDSWSAWYDGRVIASGASPEEAMRNFDKAWMEKS